MHRKEREENLKEQQMKRLFEWIWNFMVAAVVAGCILSILLFSMFTVERLDEIQQQVVELYDISVQNFQIDQGNILFVLNQIESAKNQILENQKDIPGQLKRTKKEYDERLEIIQRKINDQLLREQKSRDSLSYEYLKKVTVRVIGKKKPTDEMGWLGTGIIVKITEDFTYILTNKHVAPIGASIYISHNRQRYSVDILKNSAFVDLSLIRMNGKLSNKEVIRGFAEHEIQEKVYSVGMYLSNYFIYTEGTVAGMSRDNRLIVNLPSANGCSGSGVFNSKGEVVGLLHAGYIVRFLTMDTSKALCVPTSAIKVFLAEFL